MNLTSFIKAPILSEKTYKQMEKGIYTFLVDKRSTKPQIAKAIADQFSVKVKRVNVIVKSTMMKKIAKTRKQTTVGGGKKAIVILTAGQQIAMLMPKAESKKSQKSRQKSGQAPVKSQSDKEKSKK